MSGNPTDLSELTADELRPDHLLREGLPCLQFSGAFFLRAHFSAPWAYRSTEARAIAAMLKPGGRRLILFHIFVEGRCHLQLIRDDQDQEAQETHELAAGDIAIFPFADQHLVGDPNLQRPVPIGDLLPPLPWTALPVVRHGGGGTPTSMVCGYLLCDDLPFNPVLASLPPFIRVRPAGGPLARWVDASIQYALDASETRAPLGDPLLQRLPELLFMECLCEFARQQPAGEAGWLAALGDPVVGRALGCLHRQPEFTWSLKELARRAAASRSVLDDRFRQLLGIAPMSYLAAWRLQLAARQLRSSNAPLAEIAAAVGYGSEASFSRAFKRQIGESPGTWRRAG